MLIKTDVNQVPIQEVELVQKTRHELTQADKDAQRREAAPLTPDKAGMDVTDHRQRTGRAMSGDTLQYRLRKLIPAIYFERSINDHSKTGIYLYSSQYDPGLYKGHLMFVCGMESGIMPEFSVIEAEAQRIPDAEANGGYRVEMSMAKEIRGWRTVLAMLLRRRILSAGDIEQTFQIPMGKDSQRWQEILCPPFELNSTEVDDGIEREIGTDRERPGTSDDERGRSERDGSAPESDGHAQDADCRNEEAGRANVEETGRGCGTAGETAGRNDPGGKHRTGEQEIATGSMLPCEGERANAVHGPDSL